MGATISINPLSTSNALGSFNITSDGYVQGQAMDQPAIRYSLAGGTVATTETVAMYGGIAVTNKVGGAAGGPNSALGTIVSRATAETNITGFTVFDQAHDMIQSPESPVPVAGSGMMVNYYLLGCGARIAVACSPSLVDLEGQIITTAVTWDYTNQQLEPFVPASTTISSGTYAAAVTISSGTYVAATGLVTLTTNAAHGLLPGDPFTISGMTGTNASLLNGSQVAIAGTTGSTLTFTGPLNVVNGITITGGNLGTVGVTLTTNQAHDLVPGDTFVISGATGTGSFALLDGVQTATAGTTATTLNFVTTSGLTLTITGGNVSNGVAIPVKILDVQIGNSMTVEANTPSSGLFQWNRSGNCALIQI